MISRKTANECYVYITLPGETAFVTAGRFELATDRRGIPTGSTPRTRGSNVDSLSSSRYSAPKAKLIGPAGDHVRLTYRFGAGHDAQDMAQRDPTSAPTLPQVTSIYFHPMHLHPRLLASPDSFSPAFPVARVGAAATLPAGRRALPF